MIKKITLIMVVLATTIACKKEDSKPIDNSTNTSTYKGFFREYGSYITTINDSIQTQVSYDSSTVNLFVLTRNTNSYTLDRITPVGDTISIQDNFELNQKNEFGDTTGGGSSYYRMYIKVDTDSLFVDRVHQGGRPNVYFWEVNARKLD